LATTEEQAPAENLPGIVHLLQEVYPRIRPLTRLTEEKWIFEWPPEAEVAFLSLKKALCTAPVLG
jgi:hypothetical protein